jgi:hypothetical protein
MSSGAASSRTATKRSRAACKGSAETPTTRTSPDPSRRGRIRTFDRSASSPSDSDRVSATSR